MALVQKRSGAPAGTITVTLSMGTYAIGDTPVNITSSAAYQALIQHPFFQANGAGGSFTAEKSLTPIYGYISGTESVGWVLTKTASGYEFQAGTGSGSNPDASTTAKGVVKTSVSPALTSEPVVVGTNDPRVVADQAASTASIRTLGTSATQAAAGNHTHAASALSFAPSGTITATTIQTAIQQAATTGSGGSAVPQLRFEQAAAAIVTSRAHHLAVGSTYTSARLTIDSAATSSANLVSIRLNGAIVDSVAVTSGQTTATKTISITGNSGDSITVSRLSADGGGLVLEMTG